MQFVDNTVAFFGNDGQAAANLNPIEREHLQQSALSHRLAQLLPRLPSLAALAQAEGLDINTQLDDVPRLFFPHTLYKAHNPRWLLEHDFLPLTKWMQKLVTVNLEVVQDQTFKSIDAWMTAIEDDCGAVIHHSTGTTGTMSLIIRDRDEMAGRHARDTMIRQTWHRSHGLPDNEDELGIIWPSAGGGRSALVSFLDSFRAGRRAGEAPVVTLFESDLGADYEHHVVRARAAQARGELTINPPGNYVNQMLREAEHRHSSMSDYLNQMIDKVINELVDKRVMMIGGPLVLDQLSRAALSKGAEGLFAKNSIWLPIGGLKGRDAPTDMEATIARFVGAKLPLDGYAMTEFLSGFTGCKARRFHVSPWVVAWALDPANRWRPLPRVGVQEGRGAFLDLALRSGWGGVVTADHISIRYDRCVCGLDSPSIAHQIFRVADKDMDMSITPAKDASINTLMEEMANRL